MTPPPPGYIENEKRRLAANYARLRIAERDFGKKSKEVAALRAEIIGQEADLATAQAAAVAAKKG
jgi:hypothetical protein